MKLIFLLLRMLLLVVQRSLYVLSAGQLPPFASVAVVVKDGDKYLMIRRRDGRGYGLPGGYMKLHETAEAAAIREVKEETGYDIELTGVRQILSGRRKSTRVRAVDIIYNARVVGGTRRDSLEGQCVWVRLADVHDRLAFDYLQVLEREDAGA